MRIITLLNEKGGVAKTTSAIHIAAGLASRGKRVVLVDADPQGHATIGLGLKKAPGLYDLLVRDAEFDAVLVPVAADRYVLDAAAAGDLMVIPSNVETRNIANSIDDAFKVVDRFAELDGFADVVIFDTSPTPSLLHGSIYMATDAILYPTMLEAWSLDGLAESILHRDQAQVQRKRWNLPDIEVLGIIPTKFRAKTLEHADGLERLNNRFADLVWNPISERTIWAEAASQQKPVYMFAPGTPAALECWEIVDQVEARL
jgi:chromosome partitioning protein